MADPLKPPSVVIQHPPEVVQVYPSTGATPDIPGESSGGAAIKGSLVRTTSGSGNGNWSSSRAISTQRSSPVVKQRMYGEVSNAGGNYCFGMTRRAPAHFDAIQLVFTGAVSNANAFKASVAPMAAYGDGYSPTDAAGADITPTLITFGSTDKNDFRNPGGGAGTVTVDNASGSGDALIEGRIVSDWIDCRSLDRVDIPGAPPLYHLRVFGNGVPAITGTMIDPAFANPFVSADPEFYAGYWSPQATDFTTSKATSAYASKSWMPCVEIKFLLRGRPGYSIGVASDSIEQGWISATAVPQFGGTINGWMRRFVAKLNAAGIVASHVDLTRAGNKSILFHNRAYNSILSGGLTHLFIKPWSVNENGDGVASVPPALTRTSKLIEMCLARRIRPIIIRPWAGQAITQATGILVQTFCDQVAAAGIDVIDMRDLIGAGAAPNAEWLTLNSSGGVVDTTHINEAAHEALALRAFAMRAQLGFE